MHNRTQKCPSHLRCGRQVTAEASSHWRTVIVDIDGQSSELIFASGGCQIGVIARLSQGSLSVRNDVVQMLLPNAKLNLGNVREVENEGNEANPTMPSSGLKSIDIVQLPNIAYPRPWS